MFFSRENVHFSKAFSSKNYKFQDKKIDLPFASNCPELKQGKLLINSKVWGNKSDEIEMIKSQIKFIFNGIDLKYRQYTFTRR